MFAIEGAGHQVVEPIVVDARKAVGPVGVLPHPPLKDGLDFGELLLGSFGVGRVQLAPLDAGLDPGVVDLRDDGVERVVEQISCVPPFGPHSDVAAASPPKAWTLNDHDAISTV